MARRTRSPRRELADCWIWPRERVKLVTVSACWSAALTLAEQRRLLRLPALEQPMATWPAAGRRRLGAAGGLAAELADRLGCGVLAMRYPVVDDFAMALAEQAVWLLAGKGSRCRGRWGSRWRTRRWSPIRRRGCPALSVATPALFGARRLGLRCRRRNAPGRSHTTPGWLKLAGFPPQPDRFVGRTGVMARASAALAPRSGPVCFAGMPGGGKTACALELAYTHEHAFERLVWFKAPDEGLDIADALTRFALSLETGLTGLQMVHLLEDRARLAAFLPELTELLERSRILIVVDNIESLLAESGQWRDPRWGAVVAALTGMPGWVGWC